MSPTARWLVKTLLSLKLAFPLAAIAATDAPPSFSGQWIGKGIAKSPSGWTSPCDTMTFDLEQEPDYFNVRSGRYNCIVFRGRWKPAVIEIRGTELWRDGRIIGTLQNDRVETWARSAGGKYIQHFQLALEIVDGEPEPLLSYREVWREVATDREILAIEGHLRRVPETSSQ